MTVVEDQRALLIALILDCRSRPGPIHAFDTKRHTNAQLMLDCFRLGYIHEPVLDLTWGLGSFWTKLPGLAVVGNDADPRKGEIHHDFTAMPAPDNCAATTVFDPPYRLGGTPSTDRFDDAYGLDRYRTRAEMRAMIMTGTTEALRLASDFTLVKVQDHVSSGVLQPLTSWVITAAEATGATLLDSLHVIGGRAQPNGTSQRRARHRYSTLLVFRPARG